MRISHQLAASSSRTTVEGDRAFFLRNGTGDFLTLFSTPQTRYAGWFTSIGKDTFYKIIESIFLLDSQGNEEPVIGITLTHLAATWEYASGQKMTWYLTPNSAGLAISLSHPGRLRINLDPRGMYASPSLGRSFDLTGTKDTCSITYGDPTLPAPLYLQIRSQEQITLKQAWYEQEYPRDLARNSEPTRLFIYELGEVQTSRLSIGVALNAAEAARNALTASKHALASPTLGEAYTHDTLMTETATAKASVRQALRWLQSPQGLYAGLPWFHQVWSRDELIAALGLTPEEQREIIERYLGHELKEGELPTFVGSGTTCADGVGWLCLLIQEYDPANLSEETQHRLLRFLETAYSQLKASRQASHGLIASGHNATWMDTIGRSGYRLEIQCMFALVLELLHVLTGETQYQKERISLLGKIRTLMFKKGYLNDGLGDESRRPNVFLAYLLQPELLSAVSWHSCFDIVLKALSTPWGGLASLDRSSPDFHPLTTGQNNLSYHNGDSWFFVNNLAAIALHRLDQRTYGPQVIEILRSSTQEILWEHMLGQPGEISSASKLESFGCGIQAFSGGTYLALLNEVEGYSGKQETDSSSFFWESTADSAAESRSK